MQDRPQTGAVSSRQDVQLINAAGRGGVIFVCEHATNVIPDEFANLGLDNDALSSHIAWDIGAFAVANAMSAMFDAPLVAPAVSRLVYDCNRPAQAESAVPQHSEIYEIPGNAGLSESNRQDRAQRFYQPYRSALIETIEAALAAGRAPAVVTIHSFTPIYKGQPRDLDIGILHDTDARLADGIIKNAQNEGEITICRNEPYGPGDGVTYTLAEHAIPRGLLNAMVEIRNDLIVDEKAQQAMARRLSAYLRAALSSEVSS